MHFPAIVDGNDVADMTIRFTAVAKLEMEELMVNFSYHSPKRHGGDAAAAETELQPVPPATEPLA